MGDDLDTSGAEIPDHRVIGEDMLAAATIASGALFWAPEDTTNIEDKIGQTGTLADCAAAERELEDCYARDERYQSVTAVVTKPSPGLLSAKVNGKTDTGTFQLELEQSEGQPMRVVKLG